MCNLGFIFIWLVGIEVNQNKFVLWEVILKKMKEGIILIKIEKRWGFFIFRVLNIVNGFVIYF